MSELRDIKRALLRAGKQIQDILYWLGLIADYVVEEKSEGIWTYKKWNSGIAECWGIVTDAPSSGAIGSVKLPFAFKEKPIINCNFYYNSTDGVGFAQGQPYYTSADSGIDIFHIYLRRATGAIATSNAAGVGVYVRGELKEKTGGVLRKYISHLLYPRRCCPWII